MKSRENEASRLLDAYYVDEFGVKNTPDNIDSRAPRGTPLLSKNKFTTVTPQVNGVIRESAQSLRMNVTNKANLRYNPLLSGQPVQTNIPSNVLDEHKVWVYISPSTKARANALKGAPWDRPIRVSILYGVYYEMNRHGLRSAMEMRREPSALVLVPGIEPPPGSRSPRWGVGINQIDLQTLLNAAVGRQVTFQTKVMAAYSTGVNGLNQTLLHNLIDVSHLERIIFYDCLYEKSSGITADALKTARSRAGLSLKIVAYKCTKGGNSLDNSFNLSVVRKNPGLIHSDGVIDLSYMTTHVFPAYSALITYRSLEGGIAEGIVTLKNETPLQIAFDKMKRIVPARGRVVSQANTWNYVYGGPPPSNTVFLSTWYKDNEKVIKQFHNNLGSASVSGSIRELIWNNSLPGWNGRPSPNQSPDGEENHDLLLPDFSWEYLTP